MWQIAGRAKSKLGRALRVAIIARLQAVDAADGADCVDRDDSDVDTDKALWSDDGWSEDEDGDEDDGGDGGELICKECPDQVKSTGWVRLRLTNKEFGFVRRDQLSAVGPLVPAATRGGGGPLHAPIRYTTHHPPPQAAGFLSAACNCVSGRVAALCVISPRGGIMHQSLEDERALADGCSDVQNRDANNLNRKRMYRNGAAEMGFLRMRRQLPHCYVAAVRCIWPSPDGRYMGFKAR